MLEHLNEKQAAAKLMQAIETVTKVGASLPADLGGKATTVQVTDAVCSVLRES